MLFRREGTEINPTSPANRKLVTSGPYSFTRNPMYLGLTIISLGVAFWVGRWPMFLAPIMTFATANWAHIPFEEEKMHRQFADRIRRLCAQGQAVALRWVRRRWSRELAVSCTFFPGARHFRHRPAQGA